MDPNMVMELQQTLVSIQRSLEIRSSICLGIAIGIAAALAIDLIKGIVDHVKNDKNNQNIDKEENT